MKIACIGTGFVGVVTAAVFAKLGHQVIGLDIDATKIKALQAGTVPFFEPGLTELLVATQKTGNLTFTTNYAEAIKSAEIIFLMVGTPIAEGGQADLQYVYSAANSLAPHLQDGAIVVIKSTVPPGTNPKVRKIIHAKTTVSFEIASVPEFLKEGSAVDNTLHPDRLVLGVESDRARKILTELHAPLTTNVIVMKNESAQMCKYASNCYLATRITFINQIADLCETSGADIEEVIAGIGEDKRIGAHYWYPGLGYGGSCFPKDVKEISAYAKNMGETDSLFIAIDDCNEKRINKLMSRYDKLVGGFSHKTVVVLGLSFKPNTNDTRVAPALSVIPWLKSHGAIVRTVDPLLPADFQDTYQAATGAHVLMLLVEWTQFRNLDLTRLATVMQSPKYLLDTRNQYDPDKVITAGLQYKGIGR
ncbi:MAG: UDP-glucose/GDP-mannose dehydrogenase family protein [bacterium]